MRHLFYGLVLIFIGMSTAISGPLEDGLDAYKRGDYELAAKYFRVAAEQGDTAAQYNIGVMYRNGDGVLQDYAEAVKWYRTAAEQGDIEAQNNLGFMYDNGLGVPQDLVFAHMWFNLAAAQGNRMASENSDMTEKRMTREQIAEAQRLLREWKPSN